MWKSNSFMTIMGFGVLPCTMPWCLYGIQPTRSLPAFSMIDQSIKDKLYALTVLKLAVSDRHTMIATMLSYLLWKNMQQIMIPKTSMSKSGSNQQLIARQKMLLVSQARVHQEFQWCHVNLGTIRGWWPLLESDAKPPLHKCKWHQPMMNYWMTFVNG